MAEPLTEAEVRVLGCLVEKAMATPDAYPLTVNACLAACNQTSNRNPVVRFTTSEVEATLTRLRERKLTRVVYSPSNRGAKHRHVLDEAWGLGAAELAVLCELMLRGPQTAGELRGRAERLRLTLTPAEVEAALDALAGHEGEPGPLVVRLARQAGQREARVAHLLAGPPDPAALVEAAAPERAAGGGGAGGGLGARVEALEAEVASLRSEVEELRRRFDDLVG